MSKNAGPAARGARAERLEGRENREGTSGEARERLGRERATAAARTISTIGRTLVRIGIREFATPACSCTRGHGLHALASRRLGLPLRHQGASTTQLGELLPRECRIAAELAAVTIVM